MENGDDPYAESRNAACRAFYHRHRAKGLCGRCSDPAETGYSTCKKHRGKHGPPRGPTLTKPKCGECGGLNHNRRTCPKLKPIYSPKNECSYCHEAGHNIRACEALRKHTESYRSKTAEPEPELSGEGLVEKIMKQLGI